MRLQSGLCTGQCDVWHSLEQYQVLQRVQPLVAGAAQATQSLRSMAARGRVQPIFRLRRQPEAVARPPSGGDHARRAMLN